jgi:hypothetical protein
VSDGAATGDMAATGVLAAGLRSLLDREAAAGRSVRLWWRDDDAVRASPALTRLLALAGRHRAPVSLAVIPALAEPDLADLVRAHPLVTVLQHGFAHENHAPAGAKKCELADGRPAETVLAELSAGRGILSAMFGARFLPVLVPPWNRAAEAILARAGEIGFAAVSMHGGHGARNRIDTHLDPIAWRGDRGYVGDRAFLEMFETALSHAGRAPGAGAIGLLTHHRDHDEAVWRVLETFLAVTAAHPVVRVLPISNLLDGAP